MEMHQLRYVVAVARARNFSRAAEQCHVSQPSLSQQIQKLERELGEPLFDRTRREARLTPYGELFLGRASRILLEVEAAQREAGESRGLLRGTVSVGVLPTIAPYLLPAAIAAFNREFPGVEIVVQEDTTAVLVKAALAGEIDFALTSEPLNEERLEIQRLFSEELLLALPFKHRLARKRSIRATDLKGERLIVLKEGHCLGDQVLGFCERRDVHPHISFRSAQLETILCLVSAGLGFSLVPKMAACNTAGVAYRSFVAPKPARNVVAAWSRQRPPGRAAAEFLNRIRSR
jgi:LysR family hydrogen peroxide-inducible transcriptional activator